VEYFSDLVVDLGELTWDVITLDPEGAFNDLVDIGENLVCGGITVLDLIGGNIAESLYNNSCAAPHGIAPEVLDKLRPYFHSDFTSVVIHEACDFTNRGAITFGEHIYFPRPDPTTGAGGYHPLDATSGLVEPDGFAKLAHELVHVLQYRREGFADFMCHYWPTCGIAAELSGESGVSCGEEQEAYMHQALVLEDVQRDGDGVFTCALEDQEWNVSNVASHTCVGKELLDNCPDAANPEQTDFNGDGLGDVCYPGNECTSGDTYYQDCPAHSYGPGYTFVCEYGFWHRHGGGCQPIPDGGYEP
jgi:hypothetical protein